MKIRFRPTPNAPPKKAWQQFQTFLSKTKLSVSDYYRIKDLRLNAHHPHQSGQECERRIRQREAGIIK